MQNTIACINGFRFNVLPEGNFWDLFNYNWELDTKKLYNKYVQPDKVVLDIGAWIGPTVLIGYANNAKKIYAVEADPVNFHTLKLNCHHNYLLDKVELLNYCIHARSNNIVSFGTPATPGNSSTKTFSNNTSDGKKVITKTIEDIIAEHGIKDINFVKIDIEGAEILLKKDLIYLAQFKDISILLSMHPGVWYDRVKAVRELNKALKFYTLHDTAENEISLEDNETLMHTKRVYELFLKPKR